MTKQEKKAYRKAYYKANKDKIKANYEANKDKRKAYYQANKDKKKAYSKAYREANKDKRKAYRKAYREANKDNMKAYYEAWYEANKDKKKAYKKAWYEANKDNMKEKSKAWYEANKDKKKAYDKAYNKANKDKRNSRLKNRRKTDPIFKLKDNLRGRTYLALKSKGYKKESKTAKILGASYKIVKKHLERQFTDGMNWENYGKWHVDHIIPLASANTKDELINLCHFRNLQPLWAEDNLSKGCRIE